MPATWNATNPVTVGAATKKDHYDRAFDNLLVLREGGLALPSGAALDFIYSLTSGQLGRKAKGTALQVPRINAAANDWEFADPADATARAGGIVLASAADLDFVYGMAAGLARVAAGGALTHPRINAAGNGWEFAAVASSKLELLASCDVNYTDGAAHAPISYAMASGLSKLDTLYIEVMRDHQSNADLGASTTPGIIIYNATDGTVLVNAPAGVWSAVSGQRWYSGWWIEIACTAASLTKSQSWDAYVQPYLAAQSVIHNGLYCSNTTNWTGNWTLQVYMYAATGLTSPNTNIKAKLYVRRGQ